MKTMIVFGVALLMCSGCRDTDSPRAAQKRRDKVGKMVKAHYHSKYEFEVRGPLTLAQFEKELREFYGESLERKEETYGQAEKSVDSLVARKCDRIRLLSKEGDELYFFTSERQSWGDLDGTDGYVLVGKKKIVDGMVRSMN